MECRTPLSVKVGAGAQNTPSQRGTSALPLQRRTQQNRYYGPNTPPPTPVTVTKRLPLPKNAVLLSLIQASEPARRRSSLLSATDDDGREDKDVTATDNETMAIPAMTTSPIKATKHCYDNQEALLESPPLLNKRHSNQNDDNGAHVQSNSTKGSILFPTLSLPGDQTLASTPLKSTTMARKSDFVTSTTIHDTKDNCNEANQMEMEIYPMNQVCGTYAVADVDGLVIYPSLVELHRATRSGEGANGDERRGNADAAAGEEQVEDDQHSLYNHVGSTRSASGEDQVTPIDDEHLEEEDNLSTECNIGLTWSASTSEICGDEYARNELTIAHLLGSNISSDEKPLSLNDSPNRLLDSISMKGGTSNKDDITIETEMTKSSTEDSINLASFSRENDKSEGDDDANNKEGNESSSSPTQDESEKPLLRLKYGDRVQVVSSDPRGEWVKLARGYGYICLQHGKQLVKVGGTFDRACQVESTLHELSIERDLLKHEQTKLERLAAGLMIDLQSTLLTSDDHVICSPPKGFLHGTDSDSCDSDRMSCIFEDMAMRATNDEVTEETMNTTSSCPRMTKAPVFTARSHSPIRKANFSTTSQPQQTSTPITPTREVNWRTGLSGHRALTNSHSPHPHDFISALLGVTAKSMSNHAGVSKSKKSRPRASLY